MEGVPFGKISIRALFDRTENTAGCHVVARGDLSVRTVMDLSEHVCEGWAIRFISFNFKQNTTFILANQLLKIKSGAVPFLITTLGHQNEILETYFECRRVLIIFLALCCISITVLSGVNGFCGIQSSFCPTPLDITNFCLLMDCCFNMLCSFFVYILHDVGISCQNLVIVKRSQMQRYGIFCCFLDDSSNCSRIWSKVTKPFLKLACSTGWNEFNLGLSLWVFLFQRR